MVAEFATVTLVCFKKTSSAVTAANEITGWEPPRRHRGEAEKREPQAGTKHLKGRESGG